jgi:tetratricopeptide (TPR) repeat protein
VTVLAFVLLTPRRWLALGTLVVTGVPSALSVAVLERHPDVANGVAGSSSVAVVLLALAGVAALAFGALLFVPHDSVRVPRGLGWGVAAALAAIALGAVVAAHPVRRFDEFKQPPGALAVAHGDYVKAHLLSGSGSGRWQFWQAAVDEFDSSRLHGRGAGSYGDWWTAHGSLATSIQDAHSLYVETLGELGVVGLVLLLLPLGAAAVFVGRRLRALAPDAQVSVAGAAALVCGYAVAAGIDWMWELTAVSVVAFAALAVAVGASEPDAAPARMRRRRRPLLALGAASLAAGWLAICAAALPLLTHLEIGASQAAAREGRTVAALKTARSAVRLQPWAAQPYLQLALVSEQSGRLAVAETAIRRAIDRSPDDWHLWLVRTRIATKQGRIEEARRSLRRARALNPRSPLFSAGMALVS